MPTSPIFITYVQEQLRTAGEITARKMFGEYGLYLEGVFVGMVCDNQLFIKVTPEGEKAFPSPPKGLPYPGAKPAFLADTDNVSQTTQLLHLTRHALSNPKIKRRKCH